jgi:hypothetical protein
MADIHKKFADSTSPVTGKILINNNHEHCAHETRKPYYIHTAATIAGPEDLLEFARPGWDRVVYLTPRLRARMDLEEAAAFKAFFAGELQGEDPPNPGSVYVLTGLQSLLDSSSGLRQRMNEVDR